MCPKSVTNPSVLLVAVDLEDVELRPRSELQHRHAEPRTVLERLRRDVEDLFVERRQSIGVRGQNRDVIDPAQEHESQ